VYTEVLTFVFDKNQEKDLAFLADFVKTNFPDRKLEVVAEDNKGKIVVNVTSTLPSEFPENVSLKNILSNVDKWPSEFPRPEFETGVQTFVFNEADGERVAKVRDTLAKGIVGSDVDLKKDAVEKSILNLVVVDTMEDSDHDDVDVNVDVDADA
jgi:hypothetical protein